jgi:hypothetical protein
MDAPNEHSAFWRFVMKRLIPRWEYRYLHVFARIRLASGFFVLGLATATLLSGYPGWAALLLVAAALLLSYGYLDLMVARFISRRT